MKRARAESDGESELETQKRARASTQASVETSEDPAPKPGAAAVEVLSKDGATPETADQPPSEGSAENATTAVESESDKSKEERRSEDVVADNQKTEAESSVANLEATETAAKAPQEQEKAQADQAESSGKSTELAEAAQGEPKTEASDASDPAKTGSEDSAKPSTAPSSQHKPTFFSAFTASSGFKGFSNSATSKLQAGAKSKAAGVNPWAEPTKAAETKQAEPEETKSSSEDDSRSTPFEKQDLITGEENEVTEYSVKVRLYAVNLDSEEKAWKERGVGALKINSSNKDPSKKRLLMRADSVLRVSLNIPLVKNTQILKGFSSSLHTEKFLRITSIEDNHAHQFALRLPSEDARDRLYEELHRAIAEL